LFRIPHSDEVSVADALSLDVLMAQLRRLQKRGGLPVVSGEATDWYEVMLFPPASETHIGSLQLLLGKQLPQDFVRFWRLTNGANLFVNDSGLHGVGVASTDLLAELDREETEVYGDALQGYAVFARVNGGGDFLAFDLSTGRVLDGVHAEQPGEWRAIADSFTEWLASFVQAQGRYYWLEALYESDQLTIEN
jgi:hypothetical protein